MPAPPRAEAGTGPVVGVDLEAQDVSDVAGRWVFGVPVARDLGGVGLVEDGIEDRLAGRRGESAAIRLLDEFELALADRAPQRRRRRSHVSEV